MSKTQIFLVLMLLPFLLTSCKEENINPNPNDFTLLSALSPEIISNIDSVVAVIKISSMYTGTYDDAGAPKVMEASYAWAYLTDGESSLVAANIECNGVTMHKMSSTADDGQYEFISCTHVNDYNFTIHNYLGTELITFSENDVNTLKTVGYQQGDFVPRDGFVVNYTGYEPNANITLITPDKHGSISTRIMQATGSVAFTQFEIADLIQTDREDDYIMLGFIQEEPFRVVEIGGGRKIVLLFETMTNMTFKLLAQNQNN